MKDAVISVIALATSHETVVSLTVVMDLPDVTTIATITGVAGPVARTRVEVMTLTNHVGGMIEIDEIVQGAEAVNITTVMSATIGRHLITAETGTTAEVVDIVVVEATVGIGTILVVMSRGVVQAISIEVLQASLNSIKRSHKTRVATCKIVSG